MKTIVERIATVLLAQNQTLTTAESCTGGLIGKRLTDLPGSSAWYLGGIIAYSNEFKQRLLNVPEEILEAHGAVSPETAHTMAAHARKAAKADFAIAVTGIAGPDGGSPEKPVGLVYIAIASPNGTEVFEHRFSGDRASIREQTTEAAFAKLFDTVTAD